MKAGRNLLIAALIGLGSTDLGIAGQAAAAQTLPPAGVRFAEGPVNGAQLAIDALKVLPRTPSATPFDSALLIARPPLATYQMDTRAVAAGGSVETFRPLESLYYALMADGEPVAGVTLRLNGGRLYASSVNTAGPFLDAIAPTVQKLERDPQLQSGSYEVRLLGFAGVFGSGPSEVLWLKADAPGDDLIFVQPQPFLPEAFQENHLYPVAEFVKLLAPIIRQRMNSAAPAN